MFGNYFGHYLVENGDITAEALCDVIEAQKSARVKLGLLAVASGLLTQKQADEVNMLQQQMDKRFGDIAVEKGYLTDDQVGEMLAKQGNDYMTFVQAMTDQGVMTLEQIQDKVDEYQNAMGYSDAELEALKSGDLDLIVPIFLKEPALSKLHKDYAALIARNIMRFVDSDFRIEPIVTLQPMKVACGSQQGIFGDQSMFTGLFGEPAALLNIGSTFGKEDFAQIDEDSLDAVCEFLNVSNGLFVSAQSEAGVELDMEPPMMYPEEKTVSSEGIAYALPIVLAGSKVNIIFSVNATVELA